MAAGCGSANAFGCVSKDIDFDQMLIEIKGGCHLCLAIQPLTPGPLSPKTGRGGDEGWVG